MVSRSYPVSRLMARLLSPCSFNSSISYTSFPRNTSRLLLHSGVGAGLQPRLGSRGFFERHYGDFTTGADRISAVRAKRASESDPSFRQRCRASGSKGANSRKRRGLNGAPRGYPPSLHDTVNIGYCELLLYTTSREAGL